MPAVQLATLDDTAKCFGTGTASCTYVKRIHTHKHTRIYIHICEYMYVGNMCYAYN